MKLLDKIKEWYQNSEFGQSELSIFKKCMSNEIELLKNAKTEKEAELRKNNILAITDFAIRLHIISSLKIYDIDSKVNKMYKDVCRNICYEKFESEGEE